ncbi:MAG: hypothetical protein R3202_03820, partial [Candidatus Competibacterales bacterium]|nr:hypothetical protein [Candidatus Competibacterales bacterium]
MFPSSLRLSVLVATLLITATACAATDFPDFVTLIERNRPAVVSINTVSDPSELMPPHGDLPIPEDSPFYDY